jgi:mono/diheme cytochrome c family protein
MMGRDLSKPTKISAAIAALLIFLLSSFSNADASAAVPTFNKDVAPIVFEHCARCHRPGEVAPFPLLTYSDVRHHAKEIADLTLTRQMPPWKAVHGYGAFMGERRLSDQQIETIQAWVNGGRSEGNPSDLPAAPKFTGGWAFGQPDMVVRMPEPYTLKADGPDEFRVFVIPLNLSEERYVSAVDFRPSNPKVVHHSLFYLDSSGEARELERQEMEKSGNAHQPGYPRTGSPGFRPSGGLGGWAPGYLPEFLPENVGRPVKAGSDLILHTHFHPSGKAEREQSMVGLYFTKKPPEKILISTMHGAPLDIPAGDSDYHTIGSFTVPMDVEVAGIIPHAHLLCKEIQVDAKLPDGTPLPLIWIKDWDWNWQEQYQYANPLHIPRGTQVTMRFRYDNSADNPRNPTIPPRRVRFGEQTSDEMALVFFQILLDRRLEGFLDAARPRQTNAAPARGGIFRRLLQGLSDSRSTKAHEGRKEANPSPRSADPANEGKSPQP